MEEDSVIWITQPVQLVIFLFSVSQGISQSVLISQISIKGTGMLYQVC
jgi:hypothetical protein